QAISYDVNQVATTTTMTSPTVNWAIGKSATFNVSVASATGVVPVGNIVLQIVSTSGTVLLPAQALVNGKVSIAYIFPNTIDTYTVTALYVPAAGPGPSINFASSTSNALAQNVRTASSVTLATSAPGTNGAAPGQPITFTATVSGSGGTP